MPKVGLKGLAEFRRAEKSLALRAALARWALHLLLAGAAVVLCNALFPVPKAGRLLLLLALLLVLAWSWWRHVRQPLQARFFRPDQPSLNSLALRLGRCYPQLQDRLANAMQIADLAPAARAALSPELIRAVTDSLATLFAAIDLQAHLERAPARRACRRLAAAAGLVLAAWGLFPRTISTGLERTLFPGRENTALPLLQVSVSPGDATILRGAPVTIRAWSGSLLGGNLALELDRFGRRERMEMTRGRGDTFTCFIPALRDSLAYRIWQQKSASRSYHLRIADLPMIRSLQLRVTPPAYSHAEAFELEENIGDVSALKGSHIEWRAESNTPVVTAALRFSSSAPLPLEIKDRRLSTHFSLRAEETYFAELEDAGGLRSDNPILYHLRPLPDQYPFVRILAPEDEVTLHEDMSLPLLIQAQDDYGISAMTLAFQVAGDTTAAIDSSRFRRLPLPLLRPQAASTTVSYTWDLSPSPLLPNEVLLYFVEVRDNDSISGPKSARTALYRARFPSIYELYEEVSKSQDQTIAALQENYQKSLELKSRLDDLAQQLKRTEELTWQKKQEVGEALKEQEQLLQELQKGADQLEEMVRTLQDNQLLSSETLQKYTELQELYRDIMTPELQQSMAKVAEAMQKIDPEELRKALETHKLSEEELNKNLDRTLALLQRLKMEQQLDQAIRMTEDLRQRQEEISRQGQQPAQERRDPPEAAQKALQQDLSRLEESLAAMEQAMSGQPEMPQQQVAAARAALDQAGVKQEMQAMAQALREGQSAQMQSSAGQIESGLQQAQEQLQQAKDALTGAAARRAMQAMQRGTRSLLTLSQMQEDLMRTATGLPATSARVPEAAERQQQLSSSLDRLIDDLYGASKESMAITPQVGNALGQARQAMQKALQGLESRELGQAGGQQGQAMAGLNDAVLQLDAAMQSMMQGGGSGMSMSALMQQMQNLADGQGGINAETLGLSGLGQSLSLAQQAAMSRLAQQQGQIRKSLAQLAAEAAGIQDLPGDLDHLGGEMEQVEKDLAAHAPDRQTIERQNRILSRMLDYQKSMRQRDHSQERKAETGKNYPRTTPAALPRDLGQSRDQLQQDLLRAKQEGYARDYLELIRKYFESIREHEDNR
ncbi:MAG TPA: hypothetical protein PKI62_06195 [bacterium]|nr:hypothetical protein [bacterium]HPR86490.1 hypothetical protein [bacterium]